MKKKYFTETGIRQLWDEAEQLAMQNLSSNHQNTEIISTIRTLNQEYGQCQWQIHGQKGNPERQYLLLRAYVFQTWYNFDRRDTAEMRSRLEDAFGERNRSGNASCNPTAAQDELAYSTATNLEREDLRQFAINDYKEMIEYQNRIKKNPKSSIFSPDW